jgi:hypothetical protein
MEFMVEELAALLLLQFRRNVVTLFQVDADVNVVTVELVSSLTLDMFESLMCTYSYSIASSHACFFDYPSSCVIPCLFVVLILVGS